jgi:hypothetical protein
MNAILPFPPGNAAYADWVENSMKLKLKINVVIKINAKEFLRAFLRSKYPINMLTL